MSNSDQENSPPPTPDSETWQENPPIPKSVSSINVDEPSSKRASTMYDIVCESLQQLDITQASQKHLTDIPGPSQLTQQAFSFVSSFKHAWQLKFAIQGLSDPAVNQKALLRIDVDVSGFNVTIQNSGNEIIGHLCLKPSDFECTRPIVGQIVSLPELSKELAKVYDNSPLYMFHAMGFKDLNSHLLYIRFGRDKGEYCNANSRTSGCMEIRVSHVYYGPWKAGHETRETIVRYLSRFEWTDVEWFKQAANTGTVFAVGLYPEQLTYIVLRFFIGDFGYLEYVKEPIP